jgi:hypothetical protein
MLIYSELSWEILMRLIILTTLLLSSISAQAVPLEWTLENVVFSDGGTASGSFFFDADTSSYSNIAVVTTTGSVTTGTSYQYGSVYNAFAVNLTEIDSPDLTGTQKWLMAFGDGYLDFEELTNAGGTISINPSHGLEGSCLSAQCTDVFQSRSVVSGTVSAVPLPAAVWLFGSALAGLGWMRRKRISC